MKVTPESQDDAAQREGITRDISRFDYEHYRDEASDRLKFQIDFAQSILRNLYFVNGASIVALLTFVGNTNLELQNSWLYWSFFAFSIGIVFALGAYFGAFFSQIRFMETSLYQAWRAQYRMHGIEDAVPESELLSSMKWGNLALYSGVLAAVFSLMGFIAGAFLSLKAIL